MNLSNRRLDIGKYAQRSAKSSVGDQLLAPITGLFYDVKDNYDYIMKSTKASSTFDTKSLWKSQDHKKQYSQYKIKKE
jgi:hypothetical protein